MLPIVAWALPITCTDTHIHTQIHIASDIEILEEKAKIQNHKYTHMMINIHTYSHLIHPFLRSINCAALTQQAACVGKLPVQRRMHAQRCIKERCGASVSVSCTTTTLKGERERERERERVLLPLCVLKSGRKGHDVASHRSLRLRVVCHIFLPVIGRRASDIQSYMIAFFLAASASASS